MTGGEQAWHGSPQRYAEAFLRAAAPALESFPVCRGARLESLDIEYLTEDGDEEGVIRAVCAVAAVTFRGRRFSYRRGIWPPAHPAPTSAVIYATVLEERLLTGPRPPLAPGGTDDATEPPADR
ncbi:hypothetical protein KBZ10_15900 [Streptomyces sp. F63]|uniref:hypothetical protein n=1 Tax=Streptomyces sp. F63 TaxID=2824887 RepID=UPI001B3615F1|nr:hypothetical protein [Streptomyces sp. F63]MBQ0985975.1 hypothetical protein [Streptomyces sp. F63]